jgi:3-hydroxyacyl-CoA dehydrogenase
LKRGVDAQSESGLAVVIGAGAMGGGIAAQLANAGWQVRLLDVAGPDFENPQTRNAAAEAGLARITNNRPPLLFAPDYAARIHPGNTADHLERLREADWIIEAVNENRDLKRAIMGLIEAHAGPHTLISSNTSGLSLREMTAERSPEFRARFLGTHFLNPPRYLKLLEVIPLPETDPARITTFRQFAEQALGHRVVQARDTPGFISTRIWIAHLLDTIHTALQEGLTTEEADALTGALLGRPNSATLRMADLVGLDIIASIAQNQYERLVSDPLRERLLLPPVMQKLIAAGRLGQKSGTGFYARDGKTILALDLETHNYRPRRDVSIDAVERLARLPLPDRLSTLLAGGPEPWQRFLAAILNRLVDYVAQIGPEIANDVLTIDRVMEWGFHWEIGPCALRDCRLPHDVAHLSYSGEPPHRRYRVFGRDGGAKMAPLPEEPEWLRLADLKAAGKTVSASAEGALIDMGAGVLCVEFQTKLNTFNPGLVRLLDAARERAERDFAALVIGNQAASFSAGYDLKVFLERMAAQDWSGLDALLREIQHAFLRLKYAHVPVVAAPYGYTLGAGCECCLHCAALQAAPELTMGLPELNVGVLPAGGGTKELLARAMAHWNNASSDPFPLVERVFDTIVAAQSSTSAEMARRMGFLRPTDQVSRNADRQLYEAKQRALALAADGYTPPQRAEIRVGGPENLARLRFKLHEQWRAGRISEHDRRVADRIAWVLSGGDLAYPQPVTEEYLLRLEREAFVALVHEEKTAERMRHILATGKPLKN